MDPFAGQSETVIRTSSTCKLYPNLFSNFTKQMNDFKFNLFKNFLIEFNNFQLFPHYFLAVFLSLVQASDSENWKNTKGFLRLEGSTMNFKGSYDVSEVFKD